MTFFEKYIIDELIRKDFECLLFQKNPPLDLVLRSKQSFITYVLVFGIYPYLGIRACLYQTWFAPKKLAVADYNKGRVLKASHRCQTSRESKKSQRVHASYLFTDGTAKVTLLLNLTSLAARWLHLQQSLASLRPASFLNFFVSLSCVTDKTAVLR